MDMATPGIAAIIGGAFSYLNYNDRDPKSDPDDRILVHYGLRLLVGNLGAIKAVEHRDLLYVTVRSH